MVTTQSTANDYCVFAQSKQLRGEARINGLFLYQFLGILAKTPMRQSFRNFKSTLFNIITSKQICITVKL